MQRLWLAVFFIVVTAALVLLFVGAVGTKHRLYSRYGEVSESYEGSDPSLIREYSFT
jgi:cytochrome c-type biogenesis protein CcmE